MKKQFLVKELAKLAGVSVRTLHHYDAINLLSPAQRSESKYRSYGEKELLRLQQILLYRELGLSLATIKDILDSPDFNVPEALVLHRDELKKRLHQMNELLATINKTIHHLKNKTMKFEDMYKGFTKEQAQSYEKEAKERWGSDLVEESKARVTAMSKKGLENTKQEMERISLDLVKLMDLPADNKKVQDVIEQHFNLINRFYKVSPEIYKGLAQLYVDDERFKQNYDKYHPELAHFLKEAMLVYCEKKN